MRAVLTITRNEIWKDEKTYYTATLAASPDAAMMHQNLADVLFQEQNFTPALREFEAAQAASLRSFIPSVRDRYNASIGISTVEMVTGRLGEAWRAADDARKLDPERSEAYRVLGTIRSYEGKDNEAIPLLERAAESNPADTTAQINLGGALLQTQQTAKAERRQL